jgi:hypothetical protein
VRIAERRCRSCMLSCRAKPRHLLLFAGQKLLDTGLDYRMTERKHSRAVHRTAPGESEPAWHGQLAKAFGVNCPTSNNRTEGLILDLGVPSSGESTLWSEDRPISAEDSESIREQASGGHRARAGSRRICIALPKAFASRRAHIRARLLAVMSAVPAEIQRVLLQ